VNRTEDEKQGREGGRKGGSEGLTGGGEDARTRVSGKSFKHLGSV